jgi:hypothetical protein
MLFASLLTQGSEQRVDEWRNGGPLRQHDERPQHK